ncbi:hypothetical protein BHM03_00005061 [Ensete ventricosum]|nr:hypothetical protein BHM03_00005061 [Ensete ventricosum]
MHNMMHSKKTSQNREGSKSIHKRQKFCLDYAKEAKQYLQISSTTPEKDMIPRTWPGVTGPAISIQDPPDVQNQKSHESKGLKGAPFRGPQSTKPNPRKISPRCPEIELQSRAYL